MNESTSEKSLRILAELLAREKMHTQILMSLAYPGVTDDEFSHQMQLLEAKIDQLREYIIMM
jgi:hypothetical protein